jgi:hypothetical protein
MFTLKILRDIKKVAFHLKSLILTILMGASSTLFGVTQYSQKAEKFLINPAQLKPSLTLETKDKITNLKIPLNKLKVRLGKSKANETIEPLQLTIPRDFNELQELAKKLARRGKEKQLEKDLLKKLRKMPASNNKVEVVTLNPKDFSLINAAAYAADLAKPHHEVEIPTAPLREDDELRRELLGQLKIHLPDHEFKAVGKKIATRGALNLEVDLLPPFAKKMVRKYTVYRGPNCFHAALSFHGPYLTKSPMINVKEEKGYHPAMINYDELWRAINSYFYEVDTETSPIKYGDMLVFFNIPKDGSPWINYKWIRHTAIYLVDGFTFSKGSKSSNTPYSIKTVKEEWETWDNYTEHLGVKVFRRYATQPKTVPPVNLTDWIY